MIFKVGVSSMDATGIGDNVIITAVVRELKKKFPDAEVEVYSEGHPELFMYNPNVKKVYKQFGGDTGYIGSGHYIEKICRFYSIENPSLKGDIYLNEEEKEFAKELEMIKACCLHPAIYNWPYENWEKLCIFLDENGFYPLQIGPSYSGKDFLRMQEQGLTRSKSVPVKNIKYCDIRYREITVREMCSVIFNSDFFIGYNSGPMHIATAFEKKAICISRKDQFKEFCYPQNKNFIISTFDLEDIQDFIQKNWMPTI